MVILEQPTKGRIGIIAARPDEPAGRQSCSEEGKTMVQERAAMIYVGQTLSENRGTINCPHFPAFRRVDSPSLVAAAPFGPFSPS
jgi:hypothetical protein